MKKIFYYITDHGRGHTTRSIAIIQELLKSDVEVIIRNSNSVKFLKNYFPNIPIIPGLTDVGPKIHSNGFSIDEINSKPVLDEWIKNLETKSMQEVQIVTKFKPDLIISDISAMPFFVARDIHINSIALSNFSWYDVLKFLDFEELEILEKAYEIADLAIKLPFGTRMEHFRNKVEVGLVARIPTKSKEEVRKDLELTKSEFLVSIALGQLNRPINCDLDNIKIISMGSNIQGKNVKSLPSFIPSQNAISTSNLVIGKCGYGLISECLTNGVPFCYFLDENHLEQKAMSLELSKRRLGEKISLEDFEQLILDENFLHRFSEQEPTPIDNENVANRILEFVNN